VDAKSADQEKQEDGITKKRGGDRQPCNRFGKGRVFVRVMLYSPPSDPKVYTNME
jgi:hypothetical protein